MLSLGIAAASGAGWSSANNGTTYTLESLSAVTESGISRVDSNVYLMSADVTIQAQDKFILQGGLELRISGSSQMRIEGACTLGTETARTTITRNTEEDTPKGIYIVYDGNESIKIQNLDFLYASMRNYGATGFDISNCSFRYSNGKLSSAGALTLGKTGARFNISNCTFSENTVPAIGSGANIYCQVTISDCSIYDCTTENRNKPMINISVGADDPVVIKNVNITGAGRNMVGGISINNMMSGTGTNVVTIDSVSIRNCRYGINGIGPQKLTISRALLVDNHFETNPMNGGSGISLSSVGQEAIITGCHIENSLWGVTLIKAPANLGQVGDSISAGNNVFINNGNNGGTEGAQWKPYDLYNNGTYTVYAQNNTWSVASQTQTEIEDVIFHKNDNAELGEVIFMPAKSPMKTNTLESLSQNEESGIIKLSDGIYQMNTNVTIPETESFNLEGGLELRMADAVTLTINGPATLGSYGKRTLITRAAETDAPKGIYLTYDGLQTTQIRNLDFEYASLRNFGERGFDLDSCSFKKSNGKLNSSGALTVGKTGASFKISNSTFSENSVPAIGQGANIYCGLYITNCSFFDNNTDNSNKPQINITTGGELPVVIRNISITGTGRNKVGGIAVGNMLSGAGSNIVVIDSARIQECRYGITGVGPQQLTISNCLLKNNNHETNPNAGGSGISLSSTSKKTIITGCHIENSLWGVTVINSPANLGQIGNLASPGFNTFINNGNAVSGTWTPYDLYNNSTNTIYAQNNIWSVPMQTEEEIEKVIFHKNDNPSLGLVIFMPAGSDAVNQTYSNEKALQVIDNNIYYTGEPTTLSIFTLDGRMAASFPIYDGITPMPALNNGIYILRAGSHIIKIRI